MLKKVAYRGTCAVLFLSLTSLMGCAILQKLTYDEECLAKNRARGEAKAHYLCRDNEVSAFIRIHYEW